MLERLRKIVCCPSVLQNIWLKSIGRLSLLAQRCLCPRVCCLCSYVRQIKRGFLFVILDRLCLVRSCLWVRQSSGWDLRVLRRCLRYVILSRRTAFVASHLQKLTQLVGTDVGTTSSMARSNPKDLTTTVRWRSLRHLSAFILNCCWNRKGCLVDFHWNVDHRRSVFWGPMLPAKGLHAPKAAILILVDWWMRTRVLGDCLRARYYDDWMLDHGVLDLAVILKCRNLTLRNISILKSCVQCRLFEIFCEFVWVWRA